MASLRERSNEAIAPADFKMATDLCPQGAILPLLLQQLLLPPALS